MRISRVVMKNFRNFRDLDVTLGRHAVIVGENKVGKTNFLHALRLVLDPSLPDSARQLQEPDFWDGLPRPLTKDDIISISIDLTDYEDNEDLLTILAEHLIQHSPMVSRLTYIFRPRPELQAEPHNEADYEFIVFGGDRIDNRVGYDLRRRIPLDVLPALRDAEGDLSAWRRSPLKPLLDITAKNIDRQEITDIADNITDATNSLLENGEIRDLSESINDKLSSMVGPHHSLDTAFGFAPTDPNKLIRSIRLFIDRGKRGIGEASLGSANLLYLALKSLELEQFVQQGSRDHTFLSIEEPEAHLHPHLQRLVYRIFLQTRTHQEGGSSTAPFDPTHKTIILTTHSPHVLSVAPIKSIVLLRYLPSQQYSEAVSTAMTDLDDTEIADLERYLDVTRGEIVFSKAVILVEGDAEEYLVPVLARFLGHKFDELGITVCSVSGTNFVPYVKFLGKQGLRMPFAVLTDLDPQPDGNCLGHNRVIKLAKIIDEQLGPQVDHSALLSSAHSYGIFLNTHTLEIDLFNSGHSSSICRTIIELTDNEAAKDRARGWMKDQKTLNSVQFLKDITAIGKGRFAQRLASNLDTNACPPYIKEAVEYVVNRCT